MWEGLGSCRGWGLGSNFVKLLKSKENHIFLFKKQYGRLEIKNETERCGTGQLETWGRCEWKMVKKFTKG